MDQSSLLVFLSIMLIVIFFLDLRKKQFLNSYNEVLTGDVLSYNCQKTGIIVDNKNKTVSVFEKTKNTTYKFSDIREIKYSIFDGGRVYSNNTVSGIITASNANRAQMVRANQRSGLFILTNDIINPVWHIKVPAKGNSKQKICDRWLLIFNKYVFQ